MPAAIDPKPPKRFDQHPRHRRVARKKPVPVVLGDDAEEVKLFHGLSEREYRDRLFRDFTDFCRKHNAWVISPSHEGSRVRVQIAEGSPLLERLKQFPRYPVAILPNPSHRLSHGRFVPVREIEVQLWR